MQRANPNQNAGAPARRRLRNNPSDEAAKEIATMVRLEATPSVLFALREVFRSCQRNRNRAVQCVLHPPPVGMRSPPEQVIQAQMREYSTKARELSSIVSGGRMVEELASNGGLDQFTTQENELISTALQNRALAQTTRAAAGRMMRGISRTAALTANAANVLILELAAVVCLFTGVVVARNERGAPMDLYSFYQWLECNMADLAPLSILHEFYMATEHLVRTGQIHTLQLLREQVVQGEPANSILRKYFDDFQYVQMISGAILKISEDKFLNIVVDFTNQIVDMAGMTRGEAMQCLADSRWEFLVKLIQKSLEASSSFRVEFAEQPYRLIAPEVKEWWEIVCNGLNLTLGHPLLLGLNHVFKVKIPDGVTMKNRYVSKELDKTMPQGRLRRKLTAAMDKAHQNDLLVYNAKVNALVQQLKNEDMQNFMDESKYFENFGADGAMGLKEVSTYIVGLRDIVRGNLDDSTGHQEDMARQMEQLEALKERDSISKTLWSLLRQLRKAVVEHLYKVPIMAIEQALPGNFAQAEQHYNGMCTSWHFLYMERLTELAVKIDDAKRVHGQGGGNQVGQQNQLAHYLALARNNNNALHASEGEEDDEEEELQAEPEDEESNDDDDNEEDGNDQGGNDGGKATSSKTGSTSVSK